MRVVRAGYSLRMFEGFAESDVDVGGGVSVRVRVGGNGPALVLLHGHPRTHTTWYAVAPRLVEAGFTVACPDLRGYGQSSKPASDAEHRPYSKRAMAGDVLAVMGALGHDRFSVVGHDRGGYVALRLALDHPEAVSRLVFLGAVPILEALERCGAQFATDWWHWFFFARPDEPERVINADPYAWYGAGQGKREAMGADNYADYIRAISDPSVVHAMLEDYRAGLGVDRGHDAADRAAGRTVQCPTLVLWPQHDGLQVLYADIAAIWQPWASALTVRPFPSAHHMAEQRPEALATELATFLTG